MQAAFLEVDHAPYKKVLFPLDYSLPCEAVLPYVREMAQRPGSELTILQCLPLSVYASGGGDDHKTDASRLATHCEMALAGLDARRLIADDEPAAAIAALVEANGIDLVMMPTHGDGLIRQVLNGSVTANVLHNSGCAVWTAIHEHLVPNVAEPRYRSVVCAIAGRAAEDEHVARTAAKFAAGRGARLTLLSVVEEPNEGNIANAQDNIEQCKAAWKLDAGMRIAIGSVPKALHDAALREEADLLVVGRGHFRERLGALRSHLYDVIRNAPCPVLSV